MSDISARLKQIEGIHPEICEEVDRILTEWLRLKELGVEGYGSLEIKAQRGKLHMIHFHQAVKP